MAHRKLIWAVEVFETDNHTQRHSLSVIRRLLEREPLITVEPVYILAPSQLRLSTEFSLPQVENYRPAAESLLERITHEAKFENYLPPKVITAAMLPAVESGSAAGLAAYAEQSGAELIVVGSHGRHGVSRAFLGSFAEALLLLSRVPVLIAGNAVHRARSLDHIFYPTDFSIHSELLFRRVVEEALALNAQVTLFHAVPSPIEPVFSTGVYLLGGAWLPVHTYFTAEVQRAQNRADRWARWARRAGISVDVVVHTQPSNIADTVVQLAQRTNAGLIMMDSHSGPVRSVLIGSITRQIARHADCPVWVMRSDVLAERRASVRSGRRAA
ncbi:MAG TPA: hypothetical protein DCS07_09610 [Bdellovibrionales bacterium]|nr:MAG: hypothetical protein A2Z97_15535 [Bdellovibrionales bacterium GWB1_52_6]OFZ03975.1 MAG: hypothetical protein A2X97_08570 [Bdellovibrionales bacterium GWA1_52_35]OFZ40711.1 MAG: hypothetical protein A2070_08510 [Bdellovibrionales bacterium GWC1_52_8]HAR42868.1 hypothetical protein [Bdellovibrionales bacterium]HCM39788.1 hypothetical protein [Bdellovibrionales bacterium]